MKRVATFPATPAAVATARAFAGDALGGGVGEETRASMLLMVSELASNAVGHARSAFSVEIEASADSLMVTVTDSGEGEPVARRPAADEPSGRGLLIVETLADEWGIIDHERGKAVWARLDRPHSGGRDGSRGDGTSDSIGPPSTEAHESRGSGGRARDVRSLAA